MYTSNTVYWNTLYNEFDKYLFSDFSCRTSINNWLQFTDKMYVCRHEIQIIINY